MGEWVDLVGQVPLSLGPGALPEASAATITLTAEDAAGLADGSTRVLEAFMSGRIGVDGDVGLLMQAQGILSDLAQR